jgi:hypothetical protein
MRANAGYSPRAEHTVHLADCCAFVRKELESLLANNDIELCI